MRHVIPLGRDVAGNDQAAISRGEYFRSDVDREIDGVFTSVLRGASFLQPKSLTPCR